MIRLPSSVNLGVREGAEARLECRAEEFWRGAVLANMPLWFGLLSLEGASTFSASPWRSEAWSAGIVPPARGFSLGVAMLEQVTDGDSLLVEVCSEGVLC